MQRNGNQPVVWLLLGPKNGDNAQLRSLAHLLAWPSVEKQLYFNRLATVPNIVLGASLHSVRRGQDALRPPWPDLILTAGRRSVPAARWVQKISGGRTKLVHLGRPWGPLGWFDLVVTTPQYCLPLRDNVIHNTLPISRLPPQQLQDASTIWSARFSVLPKPRIALLVGGSSRPYVLDAQTGAALGRTANAFARRHGGSLLITAGSRCAPASFAALKKAINCPAYIHNLQEPGQENPYHAYLALADMFIVSCDSISMIAEACLMQKPVYVYAVPEHPGLRMRIAQRLRAFSQEKQTVSARLTDSLYSFLVEYGLMTSTRNQQIFLDILEEKGLITMFNQDNTLEQRNPSAVSCSHQEIKGTIARIQILFNQKQ